MKASRTAKRPSTLISISGINRSRGIIRKVFELVREMAHLEWEDVEPVLGFWRESMGMICRDSWFEE